MEKTGYLAVSVTRFSCALLPLHPQRPFFPECYRLAVGPDAEAGWHWAGKARSRKSSSLARIEWGRRRAGLFDFAGFLPAADGLFVCACAGRDCAGILLPVSGNVFGVAFSAPLARIRTRAGDKLTMSKIEMDRRTFRKVS